MRVKLLMKDGHNRIYENIIRVAHYPTTIWIYFDLIEDKKMEFNTKDVYSVRCYDE